MGGSKGRFQGLELPLKRKERRKKEEDLIENKFGIVESKLVVIYLNECTLLSPQSSTNFEPSLDKKLDLALE